MKRQSKRVSVSRESEHAMKKVIHAESFSVLCRCGLLMSVMIWHAAPVFAQGISRDRESGWRWRIGAAYRFDTEIDATWDGDAVASRVQSLYRDERSGSPEIGPVDGYADRDYEDGFVYIDPGTVDPETYIFGLTWYWGYDHAAQYTGQSVSFHSSSVSETRIDPVPLEPWSDEADMDQAGLDLMASRTVGLGKTWRLALSGGISWYPERDTRFETTRRVARESHRTWRYEDTYATPYSPFPGAPYAGTYEGPGYLLQNLPDTREQEMLSGWSRDWTAHSVVDVRFQVWDARLGPSLEWRLGSRFRLGLKPQLRLAYVDLEAEEETVIEPTSVGRITLASSPQESAWVWGGGLESEARWDVTRSWFAVCSARADWWNDEVHVRGEAYDINLDLGQWTVTAAVGREF